MFKTSYNFGQKFTLGTLIFISNSKLYSNFMCSKVKLCYGHTHTNLQCLYFGSNILSSHYKIIQSLHNKNSSGYDEITSKIIKASAVCILSPLTHIFNNALRSGIFPDRMKYSLIKPLHKKGTTDKPENYRPISLLSSKAYWKWRQHHSPKCLYLCVRLHGVTFKKVIVLTLSTELFLSFLVN